MKKRRIYLDYAAAAPMTRTARSAYRTAEDVFANPSSIHADGLAAKKVLEDARAKVAKALGAHADEIVFSSSGTESDNLAVLGAFKHTRLSSDFAGRSVHFITTVIEHPAVLEAHKHIEAMGAEVTYLPVDEGGRIDPKDLRAALRSDTVLVSIGYANNEIGTVQPLKEIAKEIRSFKKQHAAEGKAPHAVAHYPFFHTDACQAAQYLNMNVEQFGVDLLTLSGVKLGAGHGASALFVRRGTAIAPMFFGGEQERGLRPGTENAPAIAALAAALEEAQGEKEKESVRLAELRDYFFADLKKDFREVRLNGSLKDRLPNNVHVSFPNITSELLLLELDAWGVSASAGSACGAKNEGSHVLDALYVKGDEKDWGSLRFSFGPGTRKRDIDFALGALYQTILKYQEWQFIKDEAK